MLTDVTTSHVALLPLLLAVGTLLLYVVQRERHGLRIRKAGGIRAYRLASNPFTGAKWFIACARAQRRNELLAYFNGFLDLAASASAPRGGGGGGSCPPPYPPDIVEIQVKPRQRYLITRDPGHVKAVLATSFGSFGKGPDFHNLWRPFLGDGIFTTDGALWHGSRGLIRPMFARDRVGDLATFERGVRGLIGRLLPRGRGDGDGDGGQEEAVAVVVDVMDLFYRMTLDVTTDFLLGASVNSLENPQNEFAKAFNEVQSIQMMMTMLGPFHVLVPRRRYNKGIKVIDRFVMPFIEQALALPQDELEKLSNSDKDFTFLHSVARHTRDPRVLRDQIVAVLLAGRDTTAATLSWAFYELARCPARLARLRAEVLAAVGPARAPTYADLKGMDYLRHVLSETLRLYPAVPYNLRAALEDTTLPDANGGPPISVVEGDVVVYSTLAMQRRRDLYPPPSSSSSSSAASSAAAAAEGEKKNGGGGGFPDPDVFAPERWEVGWSPRPWQYLPFNGGPRICVGQNFALTEMAYCIVRILQRYDRLEYRGDWSAQKHVAEIVGRPSEPVMVALYEAQDAAAGVAT
ncbi:cytochrome P450 [Xylariaceae sp. FL0804]|nr:cytochrome P450 [Xylariaceae sp. FL0804]